MTLWQRIKQFFAPPQLWRVTVTFSEGLPQTVITSIDPGRVMEKIHPGVEYAGRYVIGVEWEPLTWM